MKQTIHKQLVQIRFDNLFTFTPFKVTKGGETHKLNSVKSNSESNLCKRS